MTMKPKDTIPEYEFPLQPIIEKDGVHRFQENRIIRTLLNTSRLTLNDLAIMDFTDEEQCQFAQLLGYSLNGYEELPYVSDKEWRRAEKKHERFVAKLEREKQ